MTYNTRGGRSFCIIPLPVVVKRPYWGTWNCNSEVVYDSNVIKVWFFFFMFGLIQRRRLKALLWGAISITARPFSGSRSLQCISLYWCCLTQTQIHKQKPTSISYRPAIRDLLLPAADLDCFMGFFFFPLHLLYNAFDSQITSLRGGWRRFTIT